MFVLGVYIVLGVKCAREFNRLFVLRGSFYLQGLSSCLCIQGYCLFIHSFIHSSFTDLFF